MMLFVTSTVWAEMRKSTSYKVDISLNPDGVVQAAQCECRVGQGPAAHCKHVATVVYGLTCFCQTGEILTELTCTQVLQTFHKAKVFKGSPMKSSQLQEIRRNSNKESPTLMYDPSPVHQRNRVESTSTFRSTGLNLTPQINPMPVLHLFQPANMHSLAHDHDYLELCPDDQYLKGNMVCIIGRLKYSNKA